MVRGAVAFAAFSLAAGAFLASPAAMAQRRTMIVPAPLQPRANARVVTTPQPAHVISRSPVPRPVMRPRETRPAVRNGSNIAENRFFSGNRGVGCNGVSIQQLLNPVPPFGFNYQYLNAVDQDLAEKAAIDPATQLALREASRFGCSSLGGGGYVLWGGGYGYPAQGEIEDQPEEAEPAQPQVIVVQVPSTTAGAQAAAPAPSAIEDSAPAEPDEVQFVLVMRDGTQVQTPAFTRSATSIVYITADGARRSIQISDLDKDATIRVNNDRGTPLQLFL